MQGADDDEEAQHEPETLPEAATTEAEDAAGSTDVVPEEPQPEQTVHEPEQQTVHKGDVVTAMEEEAAEPDADADAEAAAAEPAAAGADTPPAEDVMPGEEAAPEEEAMQEEEEEQPDGPPAVEEPMPAADTSKTAEAASGPVAVSVAPLAEPVAAKPDLAAPQPGAEAMDAEDGVELDFEEAEEPARSPYRPCCHARHITTSSC